METADRSVLIVDDSPAVRQILTSAFSRAGWEAEAVGDAQAALEQLRRRDVSVMIVDIRLPGMSGLELLRATRDWRPRVEIVVITAYGTIERAVEAMKGSAVDFLVKPFKRSHLLHAAERALARRKLLIGERECAARTA